MKFLLNFPNSNSLPGFLRTGWAQLDIAEYWIKINHLFKTIKHFKDMRSPFKGNRSNLSGLKMPESDVSQQFSDTDFSSVINPDYLKWRFFGFPVTEYKVIDDKQAISIARIGKRGVLTEVQVLFILPKSAEFRLKLLIKSYRKITDFDIISLPISKNHSLTRQLLPNLFLKVPNKASVTYKILEFGNANRFQQTGIVSHKLSYLLMRAFIRNSFLSLFGTFKAPKPGIHIINAHYVTPNFVDENDAKVFDKFLQHISKNAKLITIQEATRLVAEKQFDQKEALVAFTFDDGFAECFDVIAPILEKHKTNAAFFINANYVQSDEDYQKNYNERVNVFTKRPMNWQQIKSLHDRGHVIGSHTLDHMNLAAISEEEQFSQLDANKKILEEKLNYNCEYFAWTYGQMQHFPESALKIAQQFHPYIFSGTNYKHYFSANEAIINRRHIEPFWPKSHVNYFLSVNKKP
ncbi:polysaccharide deacetylase family protein [Flavobacterium sp. 3HN19-14]|uniref:polysaccharide deacetylase family protein n=1 Tax=Flavobacterium sp. 3HN19-14 TaxID=3448133 RepID=UPI003EDF4CFD